MSESSSLKYQTRDAKGELKYFDSLKKALSYSHQHPITKISWDKPNDHNRFRFVLIHKVKDDYSPFIQTKLDQLSTDYKNAAIGTPFWVYDSLDMNILNKYSYLGRIIGWSYSQIMSRWEFERILDVVTENELIKKYS